MSESLSERVERLDTQKMIEALNCFSDDLRNAFARFDTDQPEWLNDIRALHPTGILCLGMGGSGAGGRSLQTLCDALGRIPVCIWRDYGIPNWLDETWLVIATSYSGNTEETLNAVEETLDAGCAVIGISSGGGLAGLMEMHQKAHHIFVPSGCKPRAAFGHLFGTKVSLLWKLGILDRPLSIHVESMLERLENHIEDCNFTLNDDAQTAQLAARLLNQSIAIITSSEMAAAGERFANQLNENAACFARLSVVPEMNHNEIVAWGGTDIISDPSVEKQTVLLLDSPLTNPRVVQRMEWMQHNMTASEAWRVRGTGESLLECMLHLHIMMDWTSCALAILRNKNPSVTSNIDNLKRYLSDRGPQ